MFKIKKPKTNKSRYYLKKTMRALHILIILSFVVNMSYLGMFFSATEVQASNFKYTLEGQKMDNSFTPGQVCQGNVGCYNEGDSVPVKLTIKGLTSGEDYSMEVGHDYKDSNSNIGYEEFADPGSWNSSVSGVSFSPGTEVTQGGKTDKHYTLSFTADNEDVQLKWDAVLGSNAKDYQAQGANLHFFLVSGIDDDNVGGKKVPINLEEGEDEVDDELYCGDGVINGDEQCDGDNMPADYDDGDLFYCNNSCEVQTQDPVCDLDEEDYDYLLDFSDRESFRLVTDDISNSFDVSSVNIEDGDYEVTLYANDYHYDRDNQDQPQERYQLGFYDSQDSQTMSNPHDDLQDNVIYAEKTQMVNTQLSLSDLDYVKAHHYTGLLPDDPGPNSVNAVCAGLNKVVDEEPETPDCSLSSEDYEIIVDFDGETLISSGDLDDAQTDLINTTIADGDYEVTLEAYDGYLGRSSVSQDYEQYRVHFYDNSTQVATSSPHDDLEDNVTVAHKIQEVNTNLSISGADSVRAVHDAHPEGSSANSVEAICMGLNSVEFERYGEILSPDEDEVVSGDVDLLAYLHDKDGDDSVQWAVRQGSCSTNTVYGNVDGYNNDHDWDGYNFSSSADTSTWDNDNYCFVFNPTESTGDTQVNESVWFKVFNVSPDFSYSYVEETCIEGDGSVEVAFMNETTIGEGEDYELMWDFDDGATTTEENPSHTYTATGTYEVVLTVIDPNTSAEVTVTQTIVIEDCDFYRYGVITSPDEEEVVSGDVDLAAYLVDKDWDDDVQWAVRKDTCAPNTNTIYGNVDGFNDDYDWVNNEDFTSSTSTLSWMDGHYCFVFNPTESQDDTPVRETRWFKVFNAVPDFNYSYGEDVCIEGDGSAEVIFSNETTGTEGEYDFVWDFGDGSTSTEENPTHNYNATGTFEVTLSVHLQDSSAVATTSQMINILECEEEPFERYAEITSPDPNEVISGDLNLAAFLVDKDWDDDVQWAVRKDTCAPNTNTVYGNVDGFNDDYDWVDNRDFTSSTSTLSWLDGDYCFVFNPTESHDDISIRETRWFTIDNGPSEVNDPPVVNIEEPEDGDVLSGSVDIFGSVYEDVELSHYNISIYPGGSDFNDFSQRIHSQTVSTSTGFNNQLIYTWDTSQESDGDYIIRLAARDNQGNRDLSCDPYVGNVCSHHVIEVSVDNTDQIDGDSLGASFTHNYDLQCIEGDSSVDEDIVFSSNVSGGDMPYTYLWDFGDGATSTAENPTHTYTATGTYDVVLTVTDYSEDVATTSEQIVINYCSDEGGNGDGGDGDGGEGDGGGTASGARGTTYTPFSITNTQISMQCNADGNVDMDVTWLTNRASDSRVVYDTDSYGGNNIGSAPNYGYANSTNLDPNDVTGHSVEINDLESETVYYLRSISTFGSSVVVSQEKPLTTTLDCEQPQASEPIVLGEEGAPELVLSSEFTSNYANPGSDNVGYRITVVNNGEISSYETILSSTMPTDFSFSNIDSNVHTWDLGEILPGETKVINSSVDISEDAEIMTHIATAKVYSANHGEVDDTAELEIRAIAVLADTGFDGAEFLFLFGGLISIWGLRSGLKRRKLKYNLSK